jgi:hypothetical protein
MVIVQLEGIRSNEKSSNLIGNRNSDLPACSIVPQPTTLSHVPTIHILQKKSKSQDFSVLTEDLRDENRTQFHWYEGDMLGRISLYCLIRL